MMESEKAVRRREFLQTTSAGLVGASFGAALLEFLGAGARVSAAEPPIPYSDVPGYFLVPNPDRIKLPLFSLSNVQGYGKHAADWLSPEQIKANPPQVYVVENLKAAGPGSLQYGLDKRGPRIIVFEVGGIIRGGARIPPGEDGGKVWIAGQSAPCPGITFLIPAAKSFSIENDDVLVQHVTVRGGKDCVKVGGDTAAAKVRNIALDFCSFGVPSRSGAAVRINQAEDLTIQRSLIGGDYTRSPKLPISVNTKSDRTGFDIERTNRVTLWGNSIINANRAVRFNASKGCEVLEIVSAMAFNFDSGKADAVNVIVPPDVLAQVRVAGCFFRPLAPNSKFERDRVDQFAPEDKQISAVTLSDLV